jgi:hypothetical protein
VLAAVLLSYCVRTHTDTYCFHVGLAGLQDDLEGVTTGGGEHKDKGETYSPQKRVQPIMEIA